MAYDFSALTVLVAEDNKPMLELTKSLLATFGVGKVVSAMEGGTAFDLFCQNSPDLVLADWMMVPIDGIELARRIRNDPKSPNKFVPIVLMTGFSDKSRVLLARDIGVNEFLVKPFNARDLYRRIAQIIEKPRQFVRSDTFFGPDRRRGGRKEDYNGPMRRSGEDAPRGNLNKEYIRTLTNINEDKS